MKQTLQAYGVSKETITATIILYKNTKAMIHSPDGNTDFDILAVVLQGYIYWMSIDLIK